MLIICPECETSYEVDAPDLGPQGRKVRCASCGAVWQVVPETAAAPAPNALVAEHFSAPAVQEPDADEDDAEDDAPEDVIATPRPRRRAATPRRQMSRQRVTALSAAAGLALLAALGAWRQTVVEFMPDLAGLYAAFGMPVNLRGLEFRDMNTVETMEGGVPLLVVRGTIENITGDDVEVPRLRLAVRGVSGREIFVWTAMPTKNELKSGESLPFLAQLASPPAQGREVAVRFIGARDGLQTVVAQ